ncbi:nitroimidazol reductase NimA-like FMN-containing flavoprotein (pyridoxamine 5'-phosphate oxidase superfamily) [Pseudarthrobacter siccitolerans]|uniref:Nitroimidazol reductase NimA-like FMN-containing flavoprotein (Pyridoxamine 5'-phosphate oxidase superfamily) n=1 Tax=Pseudarthrobacter siccitolerans TaxID=861266 RepID=A0ABU0PKY0_9MICC|nr:pyridoxamine 5'-phosphate oxidase family protein [Pseudarthrobacter siccitolerans]MDQ0674622.1 nitroimidazol reductase NimA-like FMN-containing flavoprotein (pyridoxamine 5'-phosphate oxidase superfamily) [Pseudarthrobacter siccitolerans]
MTSDAGPAGKLSFDECWELLEGDTLGRLGLTVDGHPEIFPVNYVVHRGSIVFRTSGVTKLWNARAERPAALEIDGYDAHTEEAWSVVVRGDTDIIEDQADKDAVDSLGLEPWQPGEKAHYIRLTARALTGRRFKVNKPDIWNTRTTDRRRASFE